LRVAVLHRSRCQPKKCALECMRFCPGVRMGEETVRIDEGAKPEISELLCTGCGICTKKCPFEAISIVNLPDELEGEKVHQYGVNGFRLFRLPYPEEGKVTGILGENGTGKSTILRILAGELVPNFGSETGDREEVLRRFSGRQLYNYFSELYSGRLRVVRKPQHVDALPRVVTGSVAEVLQRVDERGMWREVAERLELENALGRKLSSLSGGELQRVAVAAALLREADVYILDEPSSYLDVVQRLKVARLIHELAGNRRVVVVEHDLVVLDFLAERVHVVYGVPGVYGIVAGARGVRRGINAYLRGYLREENVRIRGEELKFEVRPPASGAGGELMLAYPRMRKSYNGFTLSVEGGELYRGEVVGVLGANATGKSTFVKMLAGVERADEGALESRLRVSYKPQYLSASFTGTVEELFAKLELTGDSFFESELFRPLNLERLAQKAVRELSGGELQLVAVATCLGREAEVYLLDEPSAYLDVEHRLRLARVVRRVVEKREAVGMVVDHDLLFIDYISDRAMVFSGVPGREGYASKPVDMRSAMNSFLRQMEVTLRRDPETGRPRVNKPGSVKDREQKLRGEYYYS